MCAARPEGADGQHWHQTVARLAGALPNLDPEVTDENCVHLFTEVAQNCPAKGVVVAVGSVFGRASVVSSYAAELCGGAVYCGVSRNGNGTNGALPFLDTSKKHSFPKYTLLEGDNIVAARSWPAERPIDVLFLGAGTNPAAVLSELTAWAPHVRPGGLVCGDGWNLCERPDAPYGVRRAVEVCFGAGAPSLGTTGNFWRHRK
jgi:hypothetical protein